MAAFTISEVVKATGAKLIGAAQERVFTGVSTDTRTIKQGELFIALKGENFDGNDFTQTACDNGAAGVIADSANVKVNAGTVLFTTPGGTLDALQKLAKFHRARFQIPIIGITGSNGKTTTKDMLASILATRFNVLKTEKNFNNEIGLPLTLLKLTAEHEAAVLEMAMRARGEIRLLAEIANPTMGIITNVSQTHLESLGSVENVAKAKAELIEFIDEHGVAILNGDNKYAEQMKTETKAHVILYGLSCHQFVRAENIFSDADNIQTAFICRNGPSSFSVILPTIGIHNVCNALAAIAAGCELGLTPLEIQSGLLHFEPADMRQTIIKKDGYTIINDAYNASPTSMEAAIDTLCEISKGGRKIAVLGDMLELGHESQAAHENLGVLLAAKQLDAVITVGSLASHIAEKAKESGVPFSAACISHVKAARALEGFTQAGDTILLKGSRGMEMEKILELLS
ncbi:MAG: UDP-N-acetylmuramoyl-tripeptide--D-alanyl-D-alanine ligase [Sporomusaceae bacterium]|jgi:UDP-N-acetylmuramoyl-tripeptide--D-alanyl-D-alanine ligase|nr:UDP-N-acetylmuramoyl-tripeptide--D-alanyl-D-alanine ligase [Sporomusaceae bacterium]